MNNIIYSSSIEMPIVVVSEANARECWQKKYARAKKQKKDAAICCMAIPVSNKIKQYAREKCKFEIELTRCASRKFDSDNLVSSFKAVRDGIADWLGINDGSDRIEWRYSQIKSAKKYSIMTISVLRTVSGELCSPLL